MPLTTPQSTAPLTTPVVAQLPESKGIVASGSVPIVPPPPKFNFPLPTVAIIGPSGTGKSRSMKNLPWDRTMLIDCERKSLPFPQSLIKFYTECTTPTAVELAIAKVKNNKDGIRYVVLDSMYNYFDLLMRSLLVQFGSDVRGAYGAYAKQVKSFLDTLKNNNVIFICTGIDEIVELTDDNMKVTSRRRIATFGQSTKGEIELPFLYVLYTNLKKDEKTGEMTYRFLTNNDGICSAKSPDGVFPQYIPNDLGLVVQKLETLIVWKHKM